MKESIKVRLVQARLRSREGIRRYQPHLRHHLHPYTFHSQRGMVVPTSELNSKEKICRHIWTYGGAGIWYLMAPCPNKKARYGMTQRAIVKVELAPHPTNEWKWLLIDWEERRLGRYKKILHWEEE